LKKIKENRLKNNEKEPIPIVAKGEEHLHQQDTAIEGRAIEITGNDAIAPRDLH